MRQQDGWLNPVDTRARTQKEHPWATATGDRSTTGRHHHPEGAPMRHRNW
jgi:hypothetical protein